MITQKETTPKQKVSTKVTVLLFVTKQKQNKKTPFPSLVSQKASMAKSPMLAAALDSRLMVSMVEYDNATVSLIIR